MGITALGTACPITPQSVGQLSLSVDVDGNSLQMDSQPVSLVWGSAATWHWVYNDYGYDDSTINTDIGTITNII